MKHEVKKVAKIVDEMLTYFMVNYEAAAVVRVQRTAEGFRLHFSFRPVAIEDAELERLRRRLGAQRQPELEDYYWQLAGQAEGNNEIRLVAMMCDTGIVRRRGEGITVTLTRLVT